MGTIHVGTIDDVDDAAFKEYLRKAKEAGRIDFDETDIEIVLDKLELSQGKYLRNAGAALFCDCGINELQMAKFASNERLTFTDIRRFTGSIMELAKKAEQYIIDAMDWKVEIGSGLSRKEIPEIPLEAIREAIINSFGHKMFDMGQSNEVAIFKNRIEIYNPGPFPDGLTPEMFISGRSRPVRRNPLITRTLYYSKDMESFATGLKRIIVACEKAGCRVQFEQQAYGFAVIFYRKNGSDSQNGIENGIENKKTEALNIEDKLKTYTGKKRKNAENILLAIYANCQISISEIKLTTGLSERTIARYLKEFKEKKIISREGPEHGGYWNIL